MKTIGIIGGLAWQSSAELYRIINELVNKKLGGQHSAKCVMYSVDLDPILILRDEENWDELANIIEDAIRRIEAAGADFTVIVSNTMHKTVDLIKDRLSKPILHIADVTAQAIIDRGFKTVGLMGTKFTLTQDFYKAKMERDYGIKILVPDEEDIEFITTSSTRSLTSASSAPSPPHGSSRSSKNGPPRSSGRHSGMHRDPAPRKAGTDKHPPLRHDDPSRRSRGKEALAE